jgi:hypothetical protein
MGAETPDGMVRGVLAVVARATGGWTLAVLWPAIALGAPLLGVPIIGCGAVVAGPGVALLWLGASVVPADYRLPLGRRVAGGAAMTVGALTLLGALLVGLGETHALTLDWLRGAPLSGSLPLGGVAAAVLFAGLAYAGGFQLRWGLRPVGALLAGALVAAVVPAACAVLVLFGLVGLPLTA